MNAGKNGDRSKIITTGSMSFKERVGDKSEDEVQMGNLSDFEEDDSTSEPEEYEIHEREDDRESDEFYVNCEGCDREIEFGWEQPDRHGLIFPVEFTDFTLLPRVGRTLNIWIFGDIGDGPEWRISGREPCLDDISDEYVSMTAKHPLEKCIVRCFGVKL